MNINKNIVHEGYNVQINLSVNDVAKKFIFVYLPKENKIVIATGNERDNHTEILQRVIGSKATSHFVWGGWVKKINGKVMFFGRSKKYGNIVLGFRVVRIIQKLFYSDETLKESIYGLPNKKKLRDAKIFPHILERLRRH